MKVANLVKAYVEKYKHMRKHKKTDGEDTREVENWVQATASMTWTELVLAGDTVGITDLQLHPIASRVQRNKMIIDFIYGTFSRIVSIRKWI